MAHNEWELLRTLVACLDDERNDIYVHIDRKVKAMPELKVERAGLSVLDERVDVRWGDLSVVEAEYALFEAAVGNGPYAYYHLLSGVDLPLKGQDDIHDFFDKNQGIEFIGYTLTEINPEITRKVQRWHLFPRLFKSSNPAIKAARTGFLRAQEALGIKRNRSVDFKKGSQWVSVTDDMARLFVSRKEWVEKIFSHTFCSDEMVFQTLCWNSPLKDNIYRTDNDGKGCARAIGWRDGCLYDWEMKDLDELRRSDAMFARKFNSRDWKFIEEIVGCQR